MSTERFDSASVRDEVRPTPSVDATGPSVDAEVNGSSLAADGAAPAATPEAGTPPAALDAPWRDASRPAAERVEALLGAMTLTEKLAQLGSFWPRDRTAVVGDVAPMENALSGDADFTTASAHGLGHLTRIYGSRPVDVPRGVAELHQAQDHLITATRLGVPAIAHEECLTGITTLGATVYPAAIAWGATFDPDLIEQMAGAIGRDMAALGVQQGLAPLLDVVRDYRWGRVEETVGEDPYLVGTLGTAWVRGLQGAGVMATLKHFVGYPASRAARNHAPVSMGARELTDVMLTPFEMAVREGGVASVMNSYCDIDGVPSAADPWLLTEVLRERWGFEGTVVSDYWSVTFLHTMHRIAPTLAEAGAAAITAGLDVELPETSAYAQVEALVASGYLPEEVVDTAVRRVLRQKCETGLLDAGWRPPTAPVESIDLDSVANRAIARRVAEESVILLDNKAGLLPWGPGCGGDGRPPARLALVGPTSDDAATLFGCYSFPNHVLARYEGAGIGVEAESIRQALTAEMPGTEILWAPGCPILEADTSGLEAAAAAAADAEVCVVCVGDLAGLFGRGTSGEGCDVVDLRLPGVQGDLVEAVLATGTPTVLLVISGRPYALGAYAERAAAIVQAFMPGEEGARTVARILTGEVAPSGRLPIGIPDHPGGQPGTYLAAPLGRYSEGISNLDPRPLYPFGYGSTYTTWAYGDLRLEGAAGEGASSGEVPEAGPADGVAGAAIPSDGSLGVSFTVTNTGERAGTEVAQVYLSDEYAQVTRPVRQLVAYTRVDLEPGCSARVHLDLHAERTSFTGRDGRIVVEPGWFTLAVGPSSEDLALTGRFEITGDLRDVTAERVLSTPVCVEAL